LDHHYPFFGILKMTKHEERSIDGDWKGSYAWLSDQPDTNTAVVFVHGFLGDARGTWLSFPGMVDARQSFWPSSDLYFLDYPSYKYHIADHGDHLLRFLAQIFPKPASSLFSPFRAEPRSGYLFSLAQEWETLQQRAYRRLLLVGHSEGALVIRQAIIDACQRSEGKDPVLDAHLALFAPAHRGVLTTGWVQAVLAIARAKQLAEPLLAASPAYGEMQDSVFISGVQQSTETLLKEYGRTAFMARVLFGCGENIVRVQAFPKDIREECAPDQDHVSVCKPRGQYLIPFTFIERLVS
jgi:pimeloyl-ACP methyl ester carboxylesterase